MYNRCLFSSLVLIIAGQPNVINELLQCLDIVFEYNSRFKRTILNAFDLAILGSS